MSSLTINIKDQLKKNAQKKAKKDGVTLTFIVTQALQAYQKGELQFGLISSDDEITASFDVSTPSGKKACIDSFKKLSQ